MKSAIKEYFELEKKVIDSLDIDEIDEAVKAIVDAYKRNAVIYVFGNGGSAAAASHFVCDFNKGICEKLDRKFNFICLSDNTPIVTAIANDISYDEIFRFQLINKLKKDDLLIAISGSGNSKNVINAVNYAKEVGCKTVGLTGYSGGKLRELAEYHMHVNFDNMQIAEDLHMVFCHMMYTILSKELKNN